MSVLTQELLKKTLDYDPATGIFRWLPREGLPRWNSANAGNVALSTPSSLGYKKGTLFRKTVLAHRIAWIMMTGEQPDEIDHINGCKTDNSFANLRNVTRQTNMRNIAINSRNKSGKMGVIWHKNNKKWQADITINNKAVFLGQFTSLDDAIACRNAAEIKYGFHENHGRAA